MYVWTKHSKFKVYRAIKGPGFKDPDPTKQEKINVYSILESPEHSL